LRQEILAYPSPGGNPRHRKRDFDAYGDLQGFTKAKAEPALVFTIPDKPSELDDGLLEASEVAETQAQCGLGRSVCLQHGVERGRAKAKATTGKGFQLGGEAPLFRCPACSLSLTQQSIQ
jgi:hypothetical protein